MTDISDLLLEKALFVSNSEQNIPSALYECQIANSLTERCGHKTFQISGFWADYGLHRTYCRRGNPTSCLPTNRKPPGQFPVGAVGRSKFSMSRRCTKDGITLRRICRHHVRDTHVSAENYSDCPNLFSSNAR
jgi:hypothetical protein